MFRTRIKAFFFACLCSCLVSGRLSGEDCNANGVEDALEVKSGDAADCDANGSPTNATSRCRPSGSRLFGSLPLGVGGLVAKDFDGDTDVDIAAAIVSSNSVAILWNRGDGSFEDRLDLPVGEEPRPIVATELDGDGDLDLMTANQGSDDVSVLRNDDVVFREQGRWAVADDPALIVTGDFNGDRKADVATSSRDATLTVFAGAGDATLGSRTEFPVGDRTVSIGAADLDADGDDDLVVL